MGSLSIQTAIKMASGGGGGGGVGCRGTSPGLFKGKRVQSGRSLYAVQPDADVGRSWLRLRSTGCRTTPIQKNQDA